MSKKLISEYLPFLTEEEIASIHTSLGNDIEYVIDEAERKALTEGVVGVTRSVQANLLGIIWTLVAADETLDASWIAQPYSTDPDGTIVINMELADFAGIVPDANVFGQVGGVPSIGNGITTGGNKVAMLSAIVNPAGVARMTSLETGTVNITLRSTTGYIAVIWGDGVGEVKGAGVAATQQVFTSTTGAGEIHCFSSDASGNPSGDLTYLTCQNNNLTSLDVSGLTALTSLICYTNNLTSLDASGLTALTSLNCQYNNLTSLDVSGLTALTDLQCYSNNLTSLLATGVDLSFEYYGSGSYIAINSLSEAALIAFVDSLATTTTGAIGYGSNTGSAAFETWLTNNPTLDKGYIWANS